MSPPEPRGSVWCCPPLALLRRRGPMGAGLSQTRDGGASAARHASQPATMAEVVRERKRKMNGGLATLRRRLLPGGRRGTGGGRSSRSGDRAAPLRELLKEWSPLEVGALLEEYEALAALRDLCVQAELARPPAAALRGDLAALYDRRMCPDAELIFKGTRFPVHRAILAARCPYFRDLLDGHPSLGARIRLEAPLPNRLDASTVDDLLRYLYAGEPAPPPCPACDGESCDANYGNRTANVPDCCPSRSESVRSQNSGGGRLALDVVGGGNVCRRRPDPALLRRIASDLGATSAILHRDVRHLLDTGEFADASLVFTSEPPQSGSTTSTRASSEGNNNAAPANNNSASLRTGQAPRSGSPPSSSEYGFRPRLEIPCHRAILSARSPFFRSVIQRRCRLQGNANEPYNSIKIVLDEKVIPHKYARVLLHAVYTDQVDLNLIMRGGGTIFGYSLLGNHGSSLSEAQAITNNQQNVNTNTPPHPPSPLEEAMELYEIGRFLELDILSQGCEDIIAERLSANSLATVLKWSAQPHGSKWVHRQALRYLREEFLTVAGGPALPQLEASHLAHALRCPFLQASELDALRATLRWGEHRLVKRMEDREPNLLSHTAHSVARKGVKKRDLSDAELRELLADLLPLVRIDHILPPNNELLNQAIRRGLVSSPPSYMLGDEGSSGSRADAWIRGKGHGGLYVRPRLYMPYYEEVKALLEDQMVQETELMRMRRARYIPDIPDTLYMVSAEPRARSSASGVPVESPHGGGGPGEGDGSSTSGGLNGTGNNSGGANGESNGAAVAPAPATMRAMLAREQELRRSPACVRATSLPLSHTAEINRQIRLRVVREFNFPDSVADTLESAALALDCGACGQHRSSPCADIGSSRIRDHCSGDSGSHHASIEGSRSGLDIDEIDLGEDDTNGPNVQNAKDDTWCNEMSHSNKRSSAIISDGDQNRSHLIDGTSQQRCRPSQSGRGLSEAMPDVAMATSSLGRLRISTYNQQPHSNLTFNNRTNRNSNQGESDFDTSNNCFYSLNRDSKVHSDSSHSLSREGSTAHTPVSFMNPNQHLLQEGCGFGGFNYKGRDGTRKVQKQHSSNNTTQSQNANSGTKSGNQETAQYQCIDTENAPLQLDLGDGNQHSSPNRQTSGSQSPWNRQGETTRQNDRIRGLSATISNDYGQMQNQPCPSPSNRANYSRYLSSSQGISQTPTFHSAIKTQHSRHSTNEDKDNTPTYVSSVSTTVTTPAPIPTSPFRISTGSFPTSGFSTLQHQSRSRSPRNVQNNSTLQRPRPLCPTNNSTKNPNQFCIGQANACTTSSNPCQGFANSCPGSNTPCTSTNSDRDMHRSQSAGSIASLSIDLEKRDNKMGVQNVSGFNNQNTFGTCTLPGDAPTQMSASHISHGNHSQSPRHFRSISTLPDQMSVYADNSTSRNASYQLGANLIESTAHRNQYSADTVTSWIQSGSGQYMSNDERNQLFLRNSRENFYGSNQNYAVQREGSFRTLSSNSPFQNENSGYSARLDSPFNCLSQNGRPGSCGLTDVMNVNSLSRGESPLYAGTSSSRGNSPFRTLESTTNQFSRGNSPYSSTHRMDYASRMQNDDYCQGNLQRSSSPGCRVTYQTRNVSGSPSGLKIQQQQSARTLSSSPSSNNFNSKSRTLAGSPTGSYPLLKQNSRTLSSSPSGMFNQVANLKVHQGGSRTLSSSPSSSSSVMSFAQGNLKSQQQCLRTSSSGAAPPNTGKIEHFPGANFCQQNARDPNKSQTLRLSTSNYHMSGGTGPPRFL